MRPQKIQEKLNDLGKKYTSQFHSQFNLSNKMLGRFRFLYEKL